ncbi:hypothetical protein GCM10027093_05690 [Paraburkholderia jirisanensis]
MVGLTRAKDDTDRATVAFMFANADLASETEKAAFLTIGSGATRAEFMGDTCPSLSY